MAFEFKLPDIGEGTAEGEIVKWLVAEGDEVTEDQPLVEVMTDKATVEIPSPRDGAILKLGAAEGEILEVGETLVVFGEPGEELPEEPEEGEEVEPAEGAAAWEGEAEAVAEQRVGEPEEPEAEREGAEEEEIEEIDEARARARAERRAAEAERGEEPDGGPSPGRTLATPATRKLARELGVDLSKVQGSGPDGRIRKEDVRAFAEAAEGEPEPPEEPERRPAEAEEEAAARPAAPRPERPAKPAPRRQAAEPGEREERVPLRGLRRRIAQHMVESKTTIPHFTYVEEVDMTEVVEMRRNAKPLAEERGIKLTYLPFIVRALIPALRQYPELNSSLDEEADEIVRKRYYNIGIATQTDRGLIVPVIHDADRLNVFELAAEIERLAAAARDGSIEMDDLKDGTFTITSTGNIGGVIATPIINHPEAAILGVTQIRKRPVVVDDDIVARDMMYLCLALDHRIVDGAVAAEFTNVLVRYLEDPKLLLLETV